MGGCEFVVCAWLYSQVNSRRNTTMKIEGRSQKRAGKGVCVFAGRGAIPVVARDVALLIKVSVEITFFWHTPLNFQKRTNRLFGFQRAASAAL